MKQKKLKKTLVDQILDKAGIAHESLALNALKNDLPDDIQKEDIYKTLALTSGTQCIIGIVPLTSHLSEKKLAKAAGYKKVSMIPQKDLQKTTGYVHGANNPVGIHQKHQFPIFIDKVALDNPLMIVSAGEVGRSIRINPQELATFVHATFADICEHQLLD